MRCMCGAPFTVDEPFIVLLGDVLVPTNDLLPQLIEVYNRKGGSVIAVQEVAPEDVSLYGVIAGEEVEPGVWKVTGLVEKPPAEEAPSNLAIFGRYLLTPRVMSILPDGRAGCRRRDPAHRRAREAARGRGDVRRGRRAGPRLRHRQRTDVAGGQHRARYGARRTSPNRCGSGWAAVPPESSRTRRRRRGK